MDDRSKSAGGLINDVLANLSSLVRNEVDLARAEVSENASKAAIAVGVMAGGAIVALSALNVLAAALVAALTEIGIDGGWAALIVGVLLAVIAAVMLTKGTNDLKATSLAPTRTVKNIKRDAEAIKETTHEH